MTATVAPAAASARPIAHKHLTMSETAIGKPAATGGDSWAAHHSPGRWAHESGMILSRLGDLDAAEEHLHLALDIHGLDRRRTRAVVLADLGGVRLRQGDVDGAMATWRDFVDCSDGIRSVKVQTALQDMRGSACGGTSAPRGSGTPRASSPRRRLEIARQPRPIMLAARTLLTANLDLAERRSHRSPSAQLETPTDHLHATRQ
ncbi:tetratricopeptide repeat protein [Streptomyces goshikiensis]|uniref:tetratricopeptide repeat protein n=1 Tax=Streptomyces goshikiensis TaxID=1942 RepID=UPI0036BC280E